MTMSTEVRRATNQLCALAVTLLFALAFALLGPDKAMAQTVTGTGTIGKIPKWTGSSVIGDSAITDSSGNIGIGTASPGRLSTCLEQPTPARSLKAEPLHIPSSNLGMPAPVEAGLATPTSAAR